MGNRLGLLMAMMVLAAVPAASSFRLPDFLQSPSKGNSTKVVDWALLVAGSAGWGNYRHQADVCHAYQVLKNGGLDDDHIVVMMADDLANNIMNPHPGKLFNRPYGPDVYDGVPLDYTGENVNADTFLKVLAGHQNDSTLIGTSGKTIRSGPEDRVFVYYADHGAPGIVGMPSGSFLYADQLLKTLREKAAHKGFKDLVIYMEACEAGSMFQGMLTDELNVYATTAANAEESSWGTYCPGMAPTPPAEFDTCLGDLYSVAWMENSDHYDLRKESLETQFEKVKRRTSNDGTFLQGSHVMQYGSLIIDEEPAADYLGALNTGDGTVSAADKAVFQGLENGGHQAIPQREADLVPLWAAITRASNASARASAHDALMQVLAARSYVDATVRAAVRAVLQMPDVAAAVAGTYQQQWAEHDKELRAKGILAEPALSLPYPLGIAMELESGPVPVREELVDVFVTQPIPRNEDLPLVDDWDCLRAMVGAWEDSEGILDQYGMQHTRAFANLCNSGVTPCAFRSALAETLSGASLDETHEGDLLAGLLPGTVSAMDNGAEAWADGEAFEVPLNAMMEASTAQDALTLLNAANDDLVIAMAMAS